MHRDIQLANLESTFSCDEWYNSTNCISAVPSMFIMQKSLHCRILLWYQYPVNTTKSKQLVCICLPLSNRCRYGRKLVAYANSWVMLWSHFFLHCSHATVKLLLTSIRINYLPGIARLSSYRNLMLVTLHVDFTTGHVWIDTEKSSFTRNWIVVQPNRAVVLQTKSTPQQLRHCCSSVVHRIKPAQIIWSTRVIFARAHSVPNEGVSDQLSTLCALNDAIVHKPSVLCSLFSCMPANLFSGGYATAASSISKDPAPPHHPPALISFTPQYIYDELRLCFLEGSDELWAYVSDINPVQNLYNNL